MKHNKQDLPAYLLGELRSEEKQGLESHLESCPECRAELAAIRQVMQGAEAFQEDMEAAMAAVDWDALPGNIADTVLQTPAVTVRSRRFSRLWELLLKPSLRPVYAALLIGVIMGAVMTFVVLRPSGSSLPTEGVFLLPQGALDSMDVEVARRETLDYLEKSRYLLLDFVQSSQEGSAGFWQSDFAAQKTRDLLSKKKYLNQQLDKYKLAKARIICDQIELLFLELTQISGEMAEDELQVLRDLIVEKQILLKIKLVKKELEESEV